MLGFVAARGCQSDMLGFASRMAVSLICWALSPRVAASHKGWALSPRGCQSDMLGFGGRTAVSLICWALVAVRLSV